MTFDPQPCTLHVASPTRPVDPAAETLQAAGWAVAGPQFCGGRIGYRDHLMASICAFPGGYEAQIRRGAILLGKGLDANPVAALAKATSDARANLIADLAALP